MSLNPKDCKPGEEQYEKFNTPSSTERIQYDYRTYDGQLFSCIARNLVIARAKRNEWLGKLKEK